MKLAGLSHNICDELNRVAVNPKGTASPVWRGNCAIINSRRPCYRTFRVPEFHTMDARLPHHRAVPPRARPVAPKHFRAILINTQKSNCPAKPPGFSSPSGSINFAAPGSVFSLPLLRRETDETLNDHAHAENSISKRIFNLPHPNAPRSSTLVVVSGRRDRALCHQRADSTERGILVKVVQRLSVVDVRWYTTGTGAPKKVYRVVLGSLTISTRDGSRSVPVSFRRHICAHPRPRIGPAISQALSPQNPENCTLSLGRMGDLTLASFESQSCIPDRQRLPPAPATAPVCGPGRQ